jgi:hypothetical protein
MIIFKLGMKLDIHQSSLSPYIDLRDTLNFVVKQLTVPDNPDLTFLLRNQDIAIGKKSHAPWIIQTTSHFFKLDGTVIRTYLRRLRMALTGNQDECRYCSNNFSTSVFHIMTEIEIESYSNKLS